MRMRVEEGRRLGQADRRMLPRRGGGGERSEEKKQQRRVSRGGAHVASRHCARDLLCGLRAAAPPTVKSSADDCLIRCLGHSLLSGRLGHSSRVNLRCDLDLRAASAAACGDAVVDANLLQIVLGAHRSALRSGDDAAARRAQQEQAAVRDEVAIANNVHVSAILHTGAERGGKAHTGTAGADVEQAV